MAIAGPNSDPVRLQAARGVADAEFELRRQREFRLALVEVEAAKIRAAAKVAGDDEDAGDRDMRDTARALNLSARYLRKAESSNVRSPS